MSMKLTQIQIVHRNILPCKLLFWEKNFEIKTWKLNSLEEITVKSRLKLHNPGIRHESIFIENLRDYSQKISSII